MSSEIIRAAIVATLQAVPGIGLVHAREKYSKTVKKLTEFYLLNGKVAGGFIRRVSTRKESPDTGYTFVVFTTWEIHYFCSFIEDEDSEISFDSLLDAVDVAFQHDQTLNGTVDATVTDEQAGIRLMTSQPAMFAGVLVHYAKLRLVTEHTETI